MAKYRSKTNFASVYAGDKHGYNLGIDGSIYLKQETTPRVFRAPAIGTQGSSTGDVGASVDIHLSASPATLKVQLGYPGGVGAIVTASITTSGLTTGTLVAAAVETAINTALAADGQDGRVWAEFLTDHYVVHHQSTGLTATVAITDGVTNNIADDLKLGVPNGGTEVAGTDDADFLLYTTGGPTFEQPKESNQHRSGRFHSGIVKKKKVAEFDFDTYINMSGLAGDSIDNAVQLLMEAALGKKTVIASTAIDFEQDIPTIYLSIVRVSTIFGEYYTGGFVNNMNLNFPGDGPATVKYQGKAADCYISGLGKTSAGSSASTTVTMVTGEESHYTKNGRVMIVDTDGRTILAGADGSLYVAADPDTSVHTLTLSAAVTVGTGGYVVPWDPGAVQQTGRDNIFTDLAGYCKLIAADAAIDVTSIALEFANDHVSFDNRFGTDANAGYAPANRLTPKLTVGFDLSNENFATVVKTRTYPKLSPEIVLGSVGSTRYLKITAPAWIPSVPKIEVPQNGVTPMQLVGELFQSTPGAKDPFKLRFA